MPDDVIAKESSVHFALLITGIMNTSAAVPFLVIFLYRGETIKRQNVSVEGGGEKKPTILPRHIEVIVLCVFLLNSFVATAFIDLFPSLLTTFLMEVGMTQQVGSNLTSAYFALYAVGNFLMIFCSIYIALTKIMLFSYAGTSFLLAGVILCTIFPNEVLLSALVSLCGLSTAVIIPTIYTWINEHVTPVTGKIASGLLISGSLGISLNPLLAGYLMESYTPMWFIYLCLSKTVICTMLFIIALLLTKRFSTVKETNAGLKEDETNEIAEGQISISTYLNGKLQNTYECTHF
ncbi:uncharacterized protein LOC132749011 [Ruditapes philippinarum]|uniref:uncharacterized protein LOC132749011 n=1 Tax=Ruditapes philippinarum TaxID=129788 RepID=UPI00295C20E5|nr:uncharacterized protein LOC132749011 [Ruditapes philippinarum]